MFPCATCCAVPSMPWSNGHLDLLPRREDPRTTQKYQVSQIDAIRNKVRDSEWKQKWLRRGSLRLVVERSCCLEELLVVDGMRCCSQRSAGEAECKLPKFDRWIDRTIRYILTDSSQNYPMLKFGGMSHLSGILWRLHSSQSHHFCVDRWNTIPFVRKSLADYIHWFSSNFDSLTTFRPTA